MDGLVSVEYRHTEPEHPAVTAGIPNWLSDEVHDALTRTGRTQLWRHQAEALDHLYSGSNVALATGTGSGKSLVYQIAAMDALVHDQRATALYISPTKALGHDQKRALAWTGLRVGALDGDTDPDERDWIRQHAQLVITNPDLLSASALPRHQRWGRLLRGLRLIVIDESHVYRGVFGSNVALILRRLLRLAASYGAEPQLVTASATIGQPDAHAQLLTGRAATPVASDDSPRGAMEVSLVTPHETVSARNATAALLAGAAARDQRVLAFVPSRSGAESIALRAREHPLGNRQIKAYRAGLLADERREIEHQLRDGSLRGVATTNALELGMDISGIDHVIVCGWPGRASSFWQQIGRAGRAGKPGQATLIASDNPLDQYLVAHPDEIFGPVNERVSLDPHNEAILEPHLIAAAYELPLTDSDQEVFGSLDSRLVERLVSANVLRRRPRGVFWSHSRPPKPVANIRSIASDTVRIVEENTGSILGTVDGSAAERAVHDGATYVHQGEYFYVKHLDLDQSVALVEPSTGDVITTSLASTQASVNEVHNESRLGAGHLRFGLVTVSSQVHGYQRRLTADGALMSTHSLDYPVRDFVTPGVWWSLAGDALADFDVAGSAHAAEHAAIGLLPLLTGCDRWDVGGMSSASHPDTGECTVFVYDGHPGGVGYTKAGFDAARRWLGATLDVIRSCDCADGCPRCVQSPKCGNDNSPLDKAGAVELLRLLVD